MFQGFHIRVVKRERTSSFMGLLQYWKYAFIKLYLFVHNCFTGCESSLFTEKKRLVVHTSYFIRFHGQAFQPFVCIVNLIYNTNIQVFYRQKAVVENYSQDIFVNNDQYQIVNNLFILMPLFQNT